jgi:PKD repeat protein
MRTRTPLTVGIVLALSLMAAPAIAATVGPTGHDRIPSAVPSAISPDVSCSTCSANDTSKDGSVLGIVQVEQPTGSGLNPTMVIGGEFTNLTPKAGPEKGVSTPRSNIATFDAVTGALRSSFNPVLNGVVDDVLEGPTPNTVYIAGKFTKVGTVSASHLALLDVNTGAVVTSFKAPATNGEINTITKAGSRLLLGGFFTVAGGLQHQGLTAVNATTGAIDHAFMTIGVTERHNNSGSGSLGSIGVKDMEATPDGSKLVVVGNFRKADNDGTGGPAAALTRVQIFVADLSGASAVVTSGWNTLGYDPLCYKFAFDSTVRGVAISPDGKFFVVSATGGGTRNTLCDTAARFEFSSTGTDIQPTWIDSTGGDTLWSAEITEKAVYVGGHQRWQNNVDGVDKAAQGAVPRPGLAALDIDSGMPLAWNPGRLPRGLAVFALYASPTGLWLGSDTDYIGNFKYKRAKLAYFPLAGGAPQASEAVPTLPGDVYLGGRTTSTTDDDVSAVTGFDGTDGTGPTTVTRPMPWDSIRGAFVVGDQIFYAKTDGYFYKRTFTDQTTGTTETKIDPYNDPAWADAADGVGGTERGMVPSLYGQISTLTSLFYANDRIFYTRSTTTNGVNTHLYWRWFNADSGIIGSKEFTADGGRSWADAAGMFVSGNTLYYVSKQLNGRLRKMPFINNAPSGTVTTDPSTRDWRAKSLFIGPQAPAANAAPTASFQPPACTERTCSGFNGSGSTDSDGTIEKYEWTFGDGGTATGATPAAHTYAADGTYTITLTVTDNGGLTNSTTRQVTVAATPPPSSNLAFRSDAQASNTALSTTDSKVTIPADVQPGDTLVLFGSYAYSSSPADPSTPAGWTQAAATVSNATLQSAVWTKVATAGDAGATVSTPLTNAARSTLTVAAYQGVASTGGIGAIASGVDASTTAHKSPTVSATAGDWGVQYWSDKNTTTTSWTLPGGSGVTQRGASYGTGSGRTSALLGDSGAPIPAGNYGGVTATTNTASGRGIAWTLVLHPAATP